TRCSEPNGFTLRNVYSRPSHLIRRMFRSSPMTRWSVICFLDENCVLGVGDLRFVYKKRLHLNGMARSLLRWSIIASHLKHPAFNLNHNGFDWRSFLVARLSDDGRRTIPEDEIRGGADTH